MGPHLHGGHCSTLDRFSDRPSRVRRGSEAPPHPLATTVLGLVALAAVASLVPLPQPVGLGLFVVVIALVGILFFRFNPDGDVWELSRSYGINPWLAVLFLLTAAILLFVFRVGLIEAV